MGDLGIFIHAGVKWRKGYDSDGKMTSDFEEWVVPDSRVDHPETEIPSTSLHVYPFSAVYAGFADVESQSTADRVSGGGGGCFIETAGFFTDNRGRILFEKVSKAEYFRFL